jgi:hypothetical protein
VVENEVSTGFEFPDATSLVVHFMNRDYLLKLNRNSREPRRTAFQELPLRITPGKIHRDFRGFINKQSKHMICIEKNDIHPFIILEKALKRSQPDKRLREAQVR